MPERHEKSAFSGGWPGRSGVSAPVWLPCPDRARVHPRQSVAPAGRLTTPPPKWGIHAVRLDSMESMPSCVHRVDGQLRLDIIPWPDGSAHGTA